MGITQIPRAGFQDINVAAALQYVIVGFGTDLTILYNPVGDLHSLLDMVAETHISDFNDAVFNQDGARIVIDKSAFDVAKLNQLLTEINAVATHGFTGRQIQSRVDFEPDEDSGGYDGLSAKNSLLIKGFSWQQ